MLAVLAAVWGLEALRNRRALVPLLLLGRLCLHGLRALLRQPGPPPITFVFLDRDPGPRRERLRASREHALARIEQLPAGTVVIRDSMVGQWWYGLTVEDFTARGYQALWEREAQLRSPLSNRPREQRLRQAVLLRQEGPP